jgi:hypothetical protein
MALARHVTFVHQTEGLEEKHQEHDSDSDGDDDNDDDNTNNVGRNNHQNNSNTNNNNNNNKTDYEEEKGVVSPRMLRENISRARQHQPEDAP